MSKNILLADILLSENQGSDLTEIEDLERRIEQLEKASALLEEAALMIKEAVKMTGFEQKASGTIERLKELTSSDKNAESIVNLKRELIYSKKEHPGWTRPFASVKYANRKDI